MTFEETPRRKESEATAASPAGAARDQAAGEAPDEAGAGTPVDDIPVHGGPDDEHIPIQHEYHEHEAGHLDLLGRIEEHVMHELEDVTARFDPSFVRSLIEGWLPRWNTWFDAEVRGTENLPNDGPALVISNHSGGILSPDTPALVTAWYEHFGYDKPLTILGFDFLFGIPGMKELFSRMGGVPAGWSSAERAFSQGKSVLVYPGGDHEVYRTFRNRNLIDFGGRTGFIKLALREGVPIIPAVGHGGHHSTWVVIRGDRIARMAGLDERLRITIFPFSLFPPFGLLPSYIPHVPLPAKVTVEIGRPITFPDYGPEAADDPEAVQNAYDRVTGTMQSTLTRLSEEHPFPVLERVTAPARRRISRLLPWRD